MAEYTVAGCCPDERDPRLSKRFGEYVEARSPHEAERAAAIVAAESGYDTLWVAGVFRGRPSFEDLYTATVDPDASDGDAPDIPGAVEKPFTVVGILTDATDTEWMEDNIGQRWSVTLDATSPRLAEDLAHLEARDREGKNALLLVCGVLAGAAERVDHYAAFVDPDRKVAP